MNLNKVSALIIAATLVFIVTTTIVDIIPWYKMYSIEIKYPNSSKVFQPGDIMGVVITRRALLAFDAQVIRELIKINKFSDEMIYQVHEHYGVQKGLRTSLMHFQIPTLKMAPSLSGNSYVWRGTITYKPLGMPEKTLVYETEKFHIDNSTTAERSSLTEME